MLNTIYATSPPPCPCVSVPAPFSPEYCVLYCIVALQLVLRPHLQMRPGISRIENVANGERRGCLSFPAYLVNNSDPFAFLLSMPPTNIPTPPPPRFLCNVANTAVLQRTSRSSRRDVDFRVCVRRAFVRVWRLVRLRGRPAGAAAAAAETQACHGDELGIQTGGGQGTERCLRRNSRHSTTNRQHCSRCLLTQQNRVSTKYGDACVGLPQVVHVAFEAKVVSPQHTLTRCCRAYRSRLTTIIRTYPGSLLRSHTPRQSGGQPATAMEVENALQWCSPTQGGVIRGNLKPSRLHFCRRPPPPPLCPRYHNRSRR